MTHELADLFAKRFIARRDVKAIQYSDGSWSPHTVTNKHDGDRIPWRREDLNAHITGKQTFGHYLLDTDSQCKLFAFDIDLEKAGILPNGWPVAEFAETFNPEQWYDELDLRAAWLDRNNAGRPWMKMQFKLMAHKLMKAVTEELNIPCAAAYSGSKGVHVYAFCGLIPAEEAREGAQIVLDSIGEFEATRGTNFFKTKDRSPLTGFPNLSIEVFPKQATLDGKDLGNLMRLPLGRNRRSSDPTFFLDMTAPVGSMEPLDAIRALSLDSPWSASTDPWGK